MNQDIELSSRQCSPKSRRKYKYPNFRTNLSKYFMEYSDSTSIHGLRYLGQKRNIVESLWWLVIIVISLSFCIYLILKAYEKWKISPVIVSFASNPTPVWKVPFPAVTICPETKAKQRLYNFTHEYHRFRENQENMTLKELNKFEKVSLVCDSRLHVPGSKKLGLDAIDILSEVAPGFNETLWQCKWVGQNHTCNTLLFPTLTEEGVCFTFNMLDREEFFTNTVTDPAFDVETESKGEESADRVYEDSVGEDEFSLKKIVIPLSKITYKEKPFRKERTKNGSFYNTTPKLHNKKTVF